MVTFGFLRRGSSFDLRPPPSRPRRPPRPRTRPPRPRLSCPPPSGTPAYDPSLFFESDVSPSGRRECGSFLDSDNGKVCGFSNCRSTRGPSTGICIYSVPPNTFTVTLVTTTGRVQWSSLRDGPLHGPDPGPSVGTLCPSQIRNYLLIFQPVRLLTYFPICLLTFLLFFFHVFSDK